MPQQLALEVYSQLNSGQQVEVLLQEPQFQDVLSITHQVYVFSVLDSSQTFKIALHAHQIVPIVQLILQVFPHVLHVFLDTKHGMETAHV